MKIDFVREDRVDLTGSPAEVRAQLLRAERFLKEVASGMMGVPPVGIERPLRLASEQARNMKMNELRGMALPYRVAEFMDGYRSEDGVLAADAVAMRLDGVEYNREGERRIVELPGHVIVYSESGEIVKSSDRQDVGGDAFHHLAAHVEEDLALVLSNDGKLVYAADISRFEKTPKHPMTGKSLLLGKDLLALHGAAKTHGDILQSILESMVGAMAGDHLDALVVDLNGQQTYDFYGIAVRRAERDTFVPLMDGQGLRGILGYADVRFVPAERKVRDLLGYADVRFMPAERSGGGIRPLSQTQLRAIYHDGIG